MRPKPTEPWIADPVARIATAASQPQTLTRRTYVARESAARIGRYIEDGCITGAIIKPNQIGTLSETCEAITAAQKRGARVIVSHRSGETGDTAIIHIAKACAADAVKIGAPARERLLKFNEYIRIFS